MSDQTRDLSAVVEQVVMTHEVELAGLDENERGQVVEALSAADVAGELGVTDINDLILDAQNAEDNRQEAEEAREAQAEAADRGDYEEAHDRALEVQDNLQDAVNQGGQLSEAQLETHHDVLVLSEAEWRQEISDEAVIDSVGYAEAGSEDGAEGALDDAGDAQDEADDYGDQGDQGGRYSDQSIHSDG